MNSTPNQVRAAKQRRRRRLIAYGRYETPLVDPGPARAHIDALRTFGLSKDAIAGLAGVHEGMIEQITSPGHHQYRTTIRRDTEAAILAARFDLDQVPPHRQVDIIGTQRRIRALSCMGWSQSYLADRLDVTVAAVGFYLKPTRRYVTVGVALRIRSLYAELSHRAGPSHRCAARALRRGWVPPMAWDDDTIDDPATEPDLACLHRPTERSHSSVLEDVRFVLAHESALTLAQVGERLGMTRDAVSAAIKRAADAAGDAAVGGEPFGPLTCEAHDRFVAARGEVLATKQQMTDNAEAHLAPLTRNDVRKGMVA